MSPFSLSDLLATAVIVLFLGWGLAGLYWFWQRYQQGVKGLEHSVEEEERRFEEQARALVGDAPPPLPPPPPPVEGPPPGMPRDTGIGAVQQRLVALRILGDFQGKVTVPGMEEGAAHGLRRGGSAAILPGMPPPDALAFQCRRFDIVFVVLPGGEVHAVQRLQAAIPSLIDDPSGR